MAQNHYVRIDTKALLTRKRTDNPLEGWFEEKQFDRFTIAPFADFELVEQTDEKETVRATTMVTTHIITSDEEYKVWKLIYWDPSFSDDDVEIELLYDQFFEVVDDDCWWVDDDEIED